MRPPLRKGYGVLFEGEGSRFTIEYLSRSLDLGFLRRRQTRDGEISAEEKGEKETKNGGMGGTL